MGAMREEGCNSREDKTVVIKLALKEKFGWGERIQRGCKNRYTQESIGRAVEYKGCDSGRILWARSGRRRASTDVGGYRTILQSIIAAMACGRMRL